MMGEIVDVYVSVELTSTTRNADVYVSVELTSTARNADCGRVCEC
jgi:hypothetical protein